jgi:cytoskeletal protein RodZ
MMPSFGERLRQEREARSVGLKEIADSTKIGSRYLQALETNDFDVLPGTVFAKGYVRAYADYIGANAQALVDALVVEMDSKTEREEGDSAKAYLEALESASGGSAGARVDSESRWGTKAFIIPVISVVGLCLLAAVAYFVLSGPDTTPVTASSRAALSDTAPDEVKSAAVIPTEGAVELDAETESESVDGAAGTAASTAVKSSATTAPTEDASPERSEPFAAAADEPTSTADDTIIAKDVRDARTDRELEPLARDANRETAASTKTASAASRSEIESPDLDVPAAEVERASQPVTADANAISVPEFGVGTQIVNRRLTGESDRFEEGTKVTFWTRVVGGESGEPIRHVWLYRGAVMDTIELKLGGSHWRTYSRKTLPRGKVGPWAVELRDADGAVRARREFTCAAADG